MLKFLVFMARKQNLICWLAADEERQTENNIKKLLNKVRNEYTTVGYFMDVLPINHLILSKWQGFSQWHSNAILYHGFSSSERVLRGMDCDYRTRSIKNSPIKAQSYMLKLEYLKCTSIDGIYRYKMFENQRIVYHGYVLEPYICFREIDADTYKLFLFLRFGDTLNEIEIKNFYLKFNIAFGVFPGYISFDPFFILKNVISSSLIRCHYRQLEVEFCQNNYYKRQIGTVDKGLFEIYKTNGLNICIIIGGSELEVNKWPTNLKALHPYDARGYEINRKSTTSRNSTILRQANGCQTLNNKLINKNF